MVYYSIINLNLAQRKLIMNAFIFSKFGHCRVVCFLVRNKTIVYKQYPYTCLKDCFGDYDSTFQQLLKQNKSVSMHQRNLQIFATEIFKTKNGLTH